MITTSEVLAAAGNDLPAPSISSAVSTLFAQQVESVRLTAALIRVGNEVGADVSGLSGFLESAGSLEGGFGAATGFGSDGLHTAIALIALSGSNAPSETVENALFELRNKQQIDGGWSVRRGDPSSVFVTAHALDALGRYRKFFVINLPISRAVGYLHGRQNADGGYGEPASTAFETALVIRAILGSGIPVSAQEDTATQYLESTQLANGSWADDAYSTALAISALNVPRDTDGDGMLDAYEVANGLDINNALDAVEDLDGDGLTNLEEFQLGTQANNTDSDGDGVDDGIEVVAGSDANDAGSANRPPQIISDPATEVIEADLYSYQAAASDADGDAVSYELLRGPSGLTVSAAGLVEWVPAAGQAGFNSVIIKANDGNGGSALQQFRVNVFALGVDLVVDSVDSSAITVDPRSQVALGTVTVDIGNQGGTAFSGTVGLLVFEDSNTDGTFNPAEDFVLGTSSFSGAIASGGSDSVDVPISGFVTFEGNLVFAAVDQAGQIPELDETNNVSNSGESSRHVPTGTGYDVSVEWSWEPETTVTQARNYTTPVVSPLVDTNGDGAVNERDVPVIIVTYSENIGGTASVNVIQGDTGELLWKQSYTDSPQTALQTVPAVGDLDGDGFPEVITSGDMLRAWRNDGSLMWEVAIQHVHLGKAINIADIDSDGLAEIIYGTAVINYDGTYRYDGEDNLAYMGGSNLGSRHVVDLDLDGVPEILAGPSAYDIAGNRLWSWEFFGLGGQGPDGNHVVRMVGTLDSGATVVERVSMSILGDGFTAVANIDDDPFPEIIATTHQNGIWWSNTTQVSDAVWIFEHDGRLKFTTDIGGGFVQADFWPLFVETFSGERANSGAPSVADVDGDGEAEIIVPWAVFIEPQTLNNARRWHFTVFERDGTELYTGDLPFIGSSSTIFVPTVNAFDFDGDGADELIAYDENRFYIMAGSTGAILHEFALNRAGGGPINVAGLVVADVDNDGEAEIVATDYRTFVASAGPSTGNKGVVVLGERNGAWTHARRVWNQWMYNVANVNEDGSIPQFARNPLDVDNSLRTQVALEGVDIHAAADLTVSKVTVDANSCPVNASITARIGNGGSLHAPRRVEVDYYLGDPDQGGVLIGSEFTTLNLHPGEFEDVSLDWTLPGAGTVYVTVNRPPQVAPIATTDLQRLEHTWADASGMLLGGFGNKSVPYNFHAYDGLTPGGFWQQDWFSNGDDIDPRTPFFGARFDFPVNVTDIVISHNRAGSGFTGAGTLEFSNGFSTPITLDGTGNGATSFTEQTGIDWVRLVAPGTIGSGAGMTEFHVGGSYTPPVFRVNEGTGLLGNNKKAAGPNDVCDVLANNNPVIQSAPPLLAFVGAPYSYQILATDADPDVLQYSLTTAPAGMTVDAVTGLVTWTPTQAGQFAVSVLVSDGAGGVASQNFFIDIAQAPGGNQPPIIISSPPTAVTVGDPYFYDVDATDPNADVVFFSLLQAPSGASLNAVSGELTWSPTADQAGQRLIMLRADDGRSGQDTQSYSISVDPLLTTLPAPDTDADSDGYPVGGDCNDSDPLINPGAQEIPGNGVDDDCSLVTPDTLSADALVCNLVSDRQSYDPLGLGQFFLTVRNPGDDSVNGLQADYTLRDAGDQIVASEAQALGSMPPGAMLRSVFSSPLGNLSPGSYTARVDVSYAGDLICAAQTAVEVLSSEEAGIAFTGDVMATPDSVTQGDTSTIDYSLQNVGNEDLSNVTIRIQVGSINTEQILWTSADKQVALARSASVSGSVVFDSSVVVGGDYLAILVAEVSSPVAVASAALTVVEPDNVAPVADAGVDQNVQSGSLATLDGSASSDPDGHMISYAWTLLGVPPGSALVQPDLQGADSAMPQFTPDVDGEYVAELVVSDGQLDSDADQASVFADTPNVPRNASAGPDQSAFVGDPVALDGSASNDPDDGPAPLSYLWFFSGIPAGSASTLDTSTDSNSGFSPDIAGEYRVTLEVSDGEAADIDESVITATVPNVPPNADAGTDLELLLGDIAYLDGTASDDPDSGPGALQYLWRFVSAPAGSALGNDDILDEALPNARFVPDVAGVYVLALDVTDGEDSDSDQVAVMVTEPPQVCDVDMDGDVDKLDIRSILGARNQPASGPDDPRDADGDGVITILDARTCVLRCDLAACAILP